MVDQPSIAIINLDDADARLFSANARLSALANQGANFTMAYVPTPVCGPSRASLLTGKHSHNNGIKSNGGNGLNDSTWVAHHMGKTIPDFLPSSYYKVAAGKYGVNGVDRDNITGYDVKIEARGRGKSNAEDYWLDVMTYEAVEQIGVAADLGRPVFLYFAPSTPHGPVLPAPRHRGMYDTVVLPPVPSFNEADTSDKRWKFNNLPLLDAADIGFIRTRYQMRLEMMESVADAVEAIVEAMPAGSYIFITSDNGQMQGEHRQVKGKGNHFEESVHMPLVVLGPGLAGKTIGELVYANVDILPTVLELANAYAPTDIDGHSLVPLFGSSLPPWRTYVLLDYRPRFYGVRGKSRKFVFVRNGEREMYNLTNDPYELRNRCEIGDTTTGAEMASAANALAAASGAACWAIEMQQ